MNMHIRARAKPRHRHCPFTVKDEAVHIRQHFFPENIPTTENSLKKHVQSINAYYINSYWFIGILWADLGAIVCIGLI